MLTDGHAGEVSRKEQWESAVEDNIDYFDALCWTMALRICQLHERNVEHFTNGFDPDRSGCSSCYDIAHTLVTNDLNQILSAVAKEAYGCGQRVVPARAAERRALHKAVGQSAHLTFSPSSARQFLGTVDSHSSDDLAG